MWVVGIVSFVDKRKSFLGLRYKNTIFQKKLVPNIR